MPSWTGRTTNDEQYIGRPGQPVKWRQPVDRSEPVDTDSLVTGASRSPAQQLDRLADGLRQAGVLDDPTWQEALRAVPRHLFVPPVAWVYRDGEVVTLDRDQHPDAWWDAVHTADMPVITQFGDGAGGQADGRRAVPSSSCSAPATQFRLLDALDVQDGMRVLEIGTGTGWGAALLAQRLGDSAVTSIEVDPAVLGQAVRALAVSGYWPRLDCADGSHGSPSGAPYDRVLATCSVTRVPPAWIDQTRPGGVIVVPWGSPSGGNDVLTRLTVGADRTASGRFMREVGFMRLRGQYRPAVCRPPGLWDPAPAGTTVSTTALDPVASLLRGGAALLARLTLGEGGWSVLGGGRDRGHPDGTLVWLSDPVSSSWARVHASLPRDGQVAVEQYGSRRLWDEMEVICHWWQRVGRPDITRFGLTVIPDEQHVWLDDPSRPVLVLPNPQPPKLTSEVT